MLVILCKTEPQILLLSGCNRHHSLPRGKTKTLARLGHKNIVRSSSDVIGRFQGRCLWHHWCRFIWRQYADTWAGAQWEILHRSESRWHNYQKVVQSGGYDKPIHESCAIYLPGGISLMVWIYPSPKMSNRVKVKSSKGLPVAWKCYNRWNPGGGVDLSCGVETHLERYCGKGGRGGGGDCRRLKAFDRLQCFEDTLMDYFLCIFVGKCLDVIKGIQRISI